MIDLKRGADFPKMHQAAVLQDDALVADIPQHPGAMARQHHDLASSDAILHALLGTGHELQVACTHPLVQQSDVVLHGCGNGKTQSHALPRRKRVQAMIGLVLQASEFEDCSNLGSQESGFQPHGHASQRSEEHTSELKSLMRTSYAVFSLKKKNTKYTTNIH